MTERQRFTIQEIGEEDYEKYGLGKDGRYLGNHFNDKQEGVVRSNLPPKVKNHVKKHVEHHLKHDKPNRSKKVNEASAFFFPAVRDLSGFTATVIFKLKEPRLKKRQK